MSGLVVVLAALFTAGCAGVGAPEPGAPSSHHRVGGFANLNPSFTRPPAVRRFGFLISRAFVTTFAQRTVDLPRVPNDGRELRANRGESTVTWIGHSTLLVQLHGVNVLTDPQWSNRASPVRFAGPRRLTPPGVRFEALPPIHVVVISHDHYDHLDADTVRRLWSVHRPRFIVPLGLGAWFAALGIDDVHELDWWQSRAERGLSSRQQSSAERSIVARTLTITCVPAQHFSGRGLSGRNRTLWAGWAIAGPERRLYFAGDTGYDRAMFQAIGARVGPFDLAAIPIGAYVPADIMHAVHTTPEEALQVVEDVRASRVVAIHWGTFDLADEPPGEPPLRLAAEARRLGLGPDRVWIPKHGETRRW